MLRLFLIFAVLVYAAYKDIRTMEIPDACPAIIIAIGLLCKRDLRTLLLICAIYLALLIIFSAAGQAVPIGMGDAKLLAALGFCLGFEALAQSFAAASILSGLYAALLLLKGKAKQHQFPFCPFISAGFLCIALASGIPST